MEYLVFDDPTNWDYLMSLTPTERTRILPQTVEEMWEYTTSKVPKTKKGKPTESAGYWHFRMFLILNKKYQEAVETKNQEEIDYFYKLFVGYQKRQENNYGVFGKSFHQKKHPFRNTYKKKYSNKEENKND